MNKNYPKKIPAQKQEQKPGRQYKMTPTPVTKRNYQSCDKLKGYTALVTGGDSGIGRAVAALFALEGADVAINYLEEEDDAKKTKKLVEEAGGKCLLLPGDLKEPETCKRIVEETIAEFGKLSTLVNNAADQIHTNSIEEINPDRLERIFRTNVFHMFYTTKAALPHLKYFENSTIINTASVTAYRGSYHLLDYSATKGAIVSFTRSLAGGLAKHNIRVNAVAPGPIWTPLIPSSFPKEEVENFGKDTTLGRAGQPEEVATAYVYLASEDSSYITGQVIHPNGGEIIKT